MNLETLKALKTCIKGLTTKETITEYVLDEEGGKMKLVKQKVSEKSLPPNVDLLKLIYPHFIEKENQYESLTDEELEKEKQRLLKELNIQMMVIMWFLTQINWFLKFTIQNKLGLVIV